MRRVAIITGGSKGLGKGLVKAYLENNYKVFSIARGRSTDSLFHEVDQIEADLSLTNVLENVLQVIFKKLDEKKVQRLVLINNAASLGRVGKIQDDSIMNLQNTVHLNVTSPMILISRFLKYTEDWSCDKKIINISSGAALKAYQGWTTYCTTKAALDMLTKGVALDQGEVKNPAKIIGIYPGIIDTGMQEQIRMSKESNFKDVQRFIDYKNNGDLAKPDEVGNLIFDIDEKNDYESGAILNVRGYK